MKNSSRFELTMPMNLRRSSSGLAGSMASAKTRALNSKAESSRSKNLSMTALRFDGRTLFEQDHRAQHVGKHVALFRQRLPLERHVADRFRDPDRIDVAVALEREIA